MTHQSIFRDAEPVCDRSRWCLLLISVLSANLSAVSHCSAELVYQPKLDELYTYGVEVRLRGFESTVGQYKTANLVRRVRVEYRILTADDSGWTAEYITVPYEGMIAPADEITSRNKSEQRFQALSNPAPATSPSSPVPPIGMPRFPGMPDLSKRTETVLREARTDLTVYPGLYRFCQGKIRVSPGGEVTGVLGNGNLPLLAGHIARLPLIRLPEASRAEMPFGYKLLEPLTVLRDNQQSLKATLSIISSVSPRSDDAKKSPDAAIKEFDREIELSGGASAGLNATLSGSGFSQFSTKRDMPFGGNVDYDVDGLSYHGVSGKYNMRIGFHILESWRRTLFDIGLLPTEDALSVETVPYLSDAELLALNTQAGTSDSLLHGKFAQQALQSAPPPYDSSLGERVTQWERSPSKSSSGSTRTIMRSSSRGLGRVSVKTFIPFARVAERWSRLHHAATVMPRQWSDAAEKFTVRATLVARQADQVAVRREDNGQVVVLPLERLSQADADFAKHYGRPKPPAALKP